MSAVVHCMKAPYDVYVGRGTDPHSGRLGRWGNPFSHRPTRVPGTIQVASVEHAIDHFRGCLWREITAGSISREELAALHGQTLGCWCAPGPCHGEVIAAAAEWAWGELHEPTLLGAVG